MSYRFSDQIELPTENEAFNQEMQLSNRKTVRCIKKIIENWPFENKPIKVKPKENTTSKPNSKRRQEYVEEADDIQVEIPVEKQIADEVKPVSFKIKKRMS